MDSEAHRSIKKLTQEEELVYRLVTESAKRGIRSQDIAKKSGMNTVQINKILARLRNLDFIQSFKKPDQPSIKLWFDISLDPGEEYQTQKSFCKLDGTVNQQLLSKLCLKVIEFIRAQPKQQATYQEISLVVKASSESVTETDIQKLVDILEFDQKIERSHEDKNKYNLNLMGLWQESIIITQIPCGQCPVFSICSPGNRISPENCIYFQDW